VVVVTLSKGYDLGYIWKQVDHGLVKGRGYCLQASEAEGGHPVVGGAGRQGARLKPGQVVEREPYDLLFGEPYGSRRRAPGEASGQRPEGCGDLHPFAGRRTARHQ
jgi:hypothetical protein